MREILTLLAACVSLPALHAAAGEIPGREFNALGEAVAAYREAASGEDEAAGRELYSEAAALFASIGWREGGHRNAFGLYNLGNARYRLGELGPAIAAYRRALRLRPRFAAARRNLELARRRAPGGEPGRGPHPAAAAFFFWHYGLSPREVGAACVILYLVLLGFLTARFLAGNGDTKRSYSCPRPGTAAGVSGGLLAAMLLSYGFKLAELSRPEAVVVGKTTSARSEPSGKAVRLFDLREGAEVVIVKDNANWVFVSAGRSLRGWVERGAVEVLTERPREMGTRKGPFRVPRLGTHHGDPPQAGEHGACPPEAGHRGGFLVACVPLVPAVLSVSARPSQPKRLLRRSGLSQW